MPRVNADEAIDRLRSMLFRLSPPGLEDFGLVITFDSFLHDYLESFDTEWEVTGDELLRAPITIEALAFRLGREAITNAVKHAKATRISVDVAFGTDAVTTTVRDNGIGFDPGARKPTGRVHLGIRHSRALAASAGGTFHIDTRPGEGTAVVISLPNLTDTVADNATNRSR